MGRRNQNKKTRHHIIPTSRRKGRDVRGVCLVPQRQHDLYHRLFGNMIPEEITEWLNEIFWNEGYIITIIKRGEA